MFEKIFTYISSLTFLANSVPETAPEGHLPRGVSYADDGIHRYMLVHEGKKYYFNLMDPEQAPDQFQPIIMQGYKIFLNPKKYASKYTGASVTCNNCHFVGGNTIGGLNGGIPLVGVSDEYPRYSKRSGKTITLEQRIQNCFKRSLNGQAPPEDSKVVKALVAYLKWISFPVRELPIRPWLGSRPLHADKEPDAARGKKVYYEHCFMCHGQDGNGTSQAPPVWGSRSYNDGAGMDTIEMAAPFIKNNMPRNMPILSNQQAVDVAAFLMSQPRPHFEEPTN